MELDISWNSLTSYCNDVAVLRKECPAISCLDARNNSWKKVTIIVQSVVTPESMVQAAEFRAYILGQLRSLTRLNGHQVTSEEASCAVKLVSTSHLSLTDLLKRGVTAMESTRSLSLLPIAEQLHQSKNFELHITMTTSEWASKVRCHVILFISVIFLFFLFFQVTSLSLCSLGLCRLPSLDQLSNLKWLSLSDNSLSSLQVAFACFKFNKP